MRPPRTFSIATTSVFGLICLLPVFYMFLCPFLPRGSEGALAYSLFDSRNLRLGLNTLALGTGVAVVSLVIGAVYAFLITRTNLVGRRIFAILFIIPLLIPPYIQAVVWTHLDLPLQSLLHLNIYSLGGCIFVLALAYFPFVVTTAMAGLLSIERSREEAATLCGNISALLRHVTLPLAAPHIIAGVIFVFIFSVTDLGVPDILRTKVFSLEIFIQFSAFMNSGGAVLLSLPLICLALGLILIQRWFMGGRSYVQIGGGSQYMINLPSLPWQVAGVVFCAHVILLSSGVPVAVLLVKSGGIEAYIRVFSGSLGPIAYTLALAISASFFTVMLGLCMGYLMERLRDWKGVLISLLAMVPLAVPATSMGVGMIGVWNHESTGMIYGSSFIILMAYTARFIPYSSLVSMAGMTKAGVRLEEAALLAGAPWRRILLRIIAPLNARHLLAAFFIVFILAFGELGTTLLVIPPGRETITVKIFNLMHYGADDMVAALCIVLILCLLLISGILYLVYQRLDIGRW